MKNPKELVMKMLGNVNPVIKNLIEMAEKGDTKGVETFARNMCKEKGIDYDKEINKFAGNFK